MCGIVGLAGAFDLKGIKTMNDLIMHRGPDDSGTFFDEDARVGLAMRRLSILDLAGGHQPMCNEDGSVWIVYNGEIFNSPQLRQSLTGRHEFKTSNSDTEILIHLYEERREAMVDDLNGMFAFVIYDKKEQKLFGARDHTGIKPLYYFSGPNRFAFASELKSLLSLPDVDRQIDKQSLIHYMSLRFIPGPGTIFEGIQRLPAGCRFFYDLQSHNLDIESYWDLNFSAKPSLHVGDWREQIRETLGEAVQRWMLSDVPVACSLSGGLDSSSIVGLLSESGVSNLRTYSLGFSDAEESAFSELPVARQVADQWGTNHQELILTPETLLDDLIHMVWSLDEPYGGGLPSWYIYQFMQKDVKVGMTGTGGDELFGNYGKFVPMEKQGWARSRQAASRVIGWDGWRSKMHHNYLGALMASISVHRPYTHRNPLALYEYLYFTDAEKKKLLDRSILDCVSTQDFMVNMGYNIDTQDPRNQVMYFDFKTQLPEEFLMMTDRFSMAHSLEARVPFLDRALIELVSQIPSSVRTSATDPKYLLRETVSDLLPLEVQSGQKRGFVIPTGLWLRGRLRRVVEHLFSQEYLEAQGIFHPKFYDRFIVPHLDGKADRGERIWTALMFQLWYLVFIQEACQSKPTFRLQDIC